jgi:hypothetical protein
MMSASLATDGVSREPLARPGLGRQHLKTFGVLLGLGLILAANFILRHNLERTRFPAYPIFPDNRIPLTWRLLLPYDIGTAENSFHPKGSYHWFTTGLTVVKLAEQFFTPYTVFCTLNALLIVASFMCTWGMFRSLVFSYTVCICMAFGTQFHWVYICSPIEAFYLYVIYLEANLLCLFKVLRGGERRWRFAYGATLVLLALNHEQWLSYLAFLVPACILLWVYAARAMIPEMKPRVLFVAVCTGLVAAAYLAIRLQYGEQQSRPGGEDQMIFMYASPVLAIEDFISNVFSLLYIAISNYFPPWLVGSNSLYFLGREGVIAGQEGYHAPQSYLVAMHHVFYWYFFAGMAFTIFVYFLVRNGRTALLQGSVRHLYLTLSMLLIAAGFAIHALIKYRPYLSVPLLTYKCMSSNVGVAYLIAYCLMDARRMISRRWVWSALVAIVWAVIAYGALARPAYLSHLSKEVGLMPLPDPLQHLLLHGKQ